MGIGSWLSIIGFTIMVLSVIIFYYQEIKKALKDMSYNAKNEICLSKLIGLVLMVVGVIIMFITIVLPMQYF